MTAPERQAPAELEVSVTEAQASIPRLLRAVEEGRRVTITRHKKPIAQLVPHGVAVDELETFQALMDEAAQAIARAHDFGRRHATTPTTEENRDA